MRQLDGDAAVGAQLRVRLRELVPPRAGHRVDDLGVTEVDAQFPGPPGDLVRAAEQGDLGDAPAQQHLGGAQDPLVRALGQHQPAAPGAGPVDQVVLEHQRGDSLRAADPQPAGQVVGVHAALERAERGLDLARVGGAGAALDPAGRGHRVVAVARYRQHWEPGVHPLDQAHRARVGLLAEREDQPGQRHLPGHVCGAGRHQQVRAVARGDHQRPVGEVVQQRRHVRRAHHVVEHVAVERGLVTGEHGAAQRRRHLGHRRRRHGRHLRDGVRGNRQLGQRHRLRHAVGQRRDHCRAEVHQIVVGAAQRRRDRVGLLPEPVHHRHHDAAELGRQPGVEGQFTGAGAVAVGEIAADHHYRRAAALDLPVAGDDPGDQLLPAAVRDERARLGVRGAVQLVDRQVHPVALGEQGQDGVGAVTGDERPERAYPFHLPGQQLGQPERHRRLSAARTNAGQVHAARHDLTLQDRCNPRPGPSTRPHPLRHCRSCSCRPGRRH